MIETTLLPCDMLGSDGMDVGYQINVLTCIDVPYMTTSPCPNVELHGSSVHEMVITIGLTRENMHTGIYAC